MTREGRRIGDRAAARAIVGWAVAAALGGAGLAAAPVGAAGTPPEPAVPGTDVVHVDAGGLVASTVGFAPADDHHPGPGGAPDDDEDAPRPVTLRPTAGGPAAADGLAVGGLRVAARVGARAARGTGVAVSFVPRPGSLVAEVALVRRVGTPAAGGHVVVRRIVAVRAGRRATVRLRARGVRPGRYEVIVRAGASPRTLGTPVAAAVRIG